MLSVIHLQNKTHFPSKPKLLPIDKPKKNNEHNMPSLLIVPFQKNSPQDEIKEKQNKLINIKHLPEINGAKLISNNHCIKIFKTLKEIKKTKHNHQLIILPKQLFYAKPPPLSFFVNFTYRKQIPLYMKHRINWKLVTNKKEGYNFRWKYYASKINWNDYQNNDINIRKLKMINLFEKYKEIGNKKKFLINMILYCNHNNLNVFDYIPLSFTITKRRGCFQLNIQSLSKLMTMCNDKYKSDKGKTNLISKIKYTELFNIDGLNKSFGKITSNKTESNFSFKNQSIANNILIYIDKSFLSSKNYFIIKPINLYQGLGIKVTNSIDEIVSQAHVLFGGMEKVTSEMEEYNKTHPDKKLKTKIYKTTNILIQKYLDNPLTYYGRKFDIRCFVLVDHCLNVYMCREGHLKACSENYTLDNLNQFAHITNYSLQKHCENFSKFEYANEISYKQFKECLMKNGNDPEVVFPQIMEKMKDLIEVSMNCAGNKLMPHKNTLSFQIFGYDFIIDNNFKPWILEINYNPGLQISSQVIENIIPRMIDDAFRLTIDTIFETEYDSDCVETNAFKYKSPYHVDGYTDDENIFEFVCNINKDPFS